MSGGIEEMYREEEENVTNNSVVPTKGNLMEEGKAEQNKPIKEENEYVY